MAKESVSVFELTDVQTSKSATDVAEKRFIALNGYDAAIRKDSKLLILSSSMKEEERMRGTTKFRFQFFWALDLVRNKLVKVSRTGLAGGMGYEELPKPGIWGTNDEGTWMVLRPVEDDPAIATRKSWGINRVLPGSFEYNNKQIDVPRCFVIEVESIKYLFGRNPIDMSLPEATRASEMTDTTFKPDNARMWDGKAYYPTKEMVKEAIEAYNASHSVELSLEDIDTLFK